MFQTYADMEGYLWSFPRRDHASVGICTRLGVTSTRELWQRVDRFLLETCPGAVKQDRNAALLPMARDASLWDTPCTGPGCALLGDAAGHVHPLTGEGIAYALWSAELLAQAIKRETPQDYEDLWRQAYGEVLATATAMWSSTSWAVGAYEAMFQLAMAIALSAPNQIAPS